MKIQMSQRDAYVLLLFTASFIGFVSGLVCCVLLAKEDNPSSEVQALFSAGIVFFFLLSVLTSLIGAKECNAVARCKYYFTGYLREVEYSPPCCSCSLELL